MEQQPFMQNNNRQENNFKLLTTKNNNITKSLMYIYQILLWFSIIYTLIHQEFLIFTGILYFAYLIIELTSNTSSFLLNKNSTTSVYNKLKEIFTSAPVFKINCECYHYEKQIEEKRDNEGKIYTQEVNVKQVTYRGQDYFPYYSFRDISGLFKIDLNSDQFKNKNYIKLKFDTIINFADSISFYDYQNFKNNFTNQNMYKDQKIDIREEFYIPNLSKNNLIKIKEEEPFYVNFISFFFCTILTFGLPYELLLDKISVEGKYQIKKIVSTRYNLNSIEYDNMYRIHNPSIKLGINEFNFIPEEYGNIDQNVEVNLPTLEEIEKAKMYQEQIKVPIYNDISNNDCYDAAPVDLPTEEEINFHKKNK